MEAWANETYGEQTDGDMWGIGTIGTNVGTSDSIWFIPSKSEWSAFGDVFEITGDNYSEFGLLVLVVFGVLVLLRVWRDLWPRLH